MGLRNCTAILLMLCGLGIAVGAEPVSRPSNTPAGNTGFTTPMALTVGLADAIEARDEQALRRVFGIDSRFPDSTDALLISDLLATLRLRDAMVARFEVKETDAAMKSCRWVQLPDVANLRSTQWTMDGDAVIRVHQAGSSEDYCRLAGTILWTRKDGQEWHFGCSIPASGAVTERMDRQQYACIEQIEEQTAAVKAGWYQKAGDVIQTLQKALDWWEKQDAYLEKMADGLRDLTGKQLPKGIFNFGADGKIVVLWKTQTYKVQRPEGKNQDTRVVVNDEVGPAPDGLRLTVWLSDEIGQAKRPQTLDVDGKWKTLLGERDVPELKTQLFYNLEYGPQTDPELVKTFSSPELWLAAVKQESTTQPGP